MTTGFEVINQNLWITKDPEAELTYTFEWNEWLPTGDALSTAVYSIQARVNDPDPLLRVTSGIQGTKTYIELKNGQLGKSYVVTVKVTTTDGLVDARNFRVKIENRSA
jgi:hypothetical protein